MPFQTSKIDQVRTLSIVRDHFATVIKWHGGIKCFLCLSYRHFVTSKFVFSTPSYILAWILMKLGTDVVP